MAFFFDFSGKLFIIFSVFVLFLQANTTLAFDLSKFLAISKPKPSEEPVIIINFFQLGLYLMDLMVHLYIF